MPPHISKLSFQYGFKVFLMTAVVLVCSPLMVATAKGSGNPREFVRRVNKRREDLLTEDITFIQSISSNDWHMSVVRTVTFLRF